MLYSIFIAVLMRNTKGDINGTPVTSKWEKNIANLSLTSWFTHTHKKTEDEAAAPQMAENWGQLSIVNPALQIARVHDHDILMYLLWFFSTCRQIQFVDTFMNPLNMVNIGVIHGFRCITFPRIPENSSILGRTRTRSRPT